MQTLSSAFNSLSLFIFTMSWVELRCVERLAYLISVSYHVWELIFKINIIHGSHSERYIYTHNDRFFCLNEWIKSDNTRKNVLFESGCDQGLRTFLMLLPNGKRTAVNKTWYKFKWGSKQTIFAAPGCCYSLYHSIHEVCISAEYHFSCLALH